MGRSWVALGALLVAFGFSWAALGVSLCLFGLPGAILEVCGAILGGFGRPMDGVDLIICVAIWMPNKARAPLTCDDVLAVCIASRNRLRSASLFGRISEDFRGQHGGQNSIFESFFSMFFLISFLRRFLIDL